MVRGDGQQSRVFYKGAENDFIVFVADDNMLRQWKQDKSIPLVEVVESYDVFLTSNQGATGILDHASRATLESEFGTHNEDEVILKILEQGSFQGNQAHHREGKRNMSKGGGGGLASREPVHQ